MDDANPSHCEKSANIRPDLLDALFALIIENVSRYAGDRDQDAIRREFLEPLARSKVELEKCSPLCRDSVVLVATTLSHLSGESEPVRKFREKTRMALVRNAKEKTEERLARDKYLSRDLIKPGAIKRLLKQTEADSVKVSRATMYRRRKTALKPKD
jgi:hypothetical protein